MRKSDRTLYLTAILLCFAVLTLLLSAVYLIFRQPTTEPPSKESQPQIVYGAEVRAASLRYDVSASRIYAVIQTESSFRPTVVSKSGAVGLMQMLPSTYKEQCAKRGADFDAEDLKDPAVNIDYCTEYLKQLYDMTGSWDLAHLAYHAGIGNVRRWLADPACSSDGKTLDVIPIKASQTYLERINAAFAAYDRVLAEEEKQDI